MGGWLKASPWKIGENRDGDWGGSGTRKCAKALFVTKPKRDMKDQINEKVNVMVERLTQCDIGRSPGKINTEIRMEISKTQVAGGSNIGVPTEYRVTQGDDHSETMVTVDTFRTCGDESKAEKADLRARKGWRRREGKGSGGTNKESLTVGHKRQGRQLNGMGLDEMEMEEMRIFKKVGIDSGVSREGDQSLTDEKVASPTKWALGGP